MRKIIPLLCLLALSAVAQNANATLFQFATRASWEAQTTGLVTHDFNDRANTYYTKLTLGDVTFTSPYGIHNNLLWITDPNNSSNFGIALAANVPGSPLHATFNPGTTAVGVEVRNRWFPPPTRTIRVSVTTNDGGSAVFNVDTADFTFFGVVTDTGHITSVVFEALGVNTTPVIDNFSYGDYEPSVIVDQSAGQTGGYIQSQYFPNIPTYSVSVFDDFTIGTAYKITELTTLGRDYYGSPASNLSVVAGIYAAPDLTIPPIVSASGIEVGGNLLFNFGGAVLPAGTYWVSAHVVRPNSAGGWYWNLRAPVRGSQAMWHNPGGGFGLGTAPVRLDAVLVQADLAFLLYGIPRETTATPTFSPQAGTYNTSQLVTVSCATAGATIHYTTNGADPTESDPVVASGGTVLVDRSLTLKAKAWLQAWSPSAIRSAVYTINGGPVGTVATPTFSPAPGTYSTPRTVTVRCATPGATIRYTTNGLTPTESDAVIVSGNTVLVGRTLTLKAKAFKPAWNSSTVTSAVYTMKVATPTFSSGGGNSENPVIVTISCVTSGATIRYTTNGSTPTASHPAISSGSSLLIDHSLTLKAKAWRSGWTASDIRSATFTIGSDGGDGGPNE